MRRNRDPTSSPPRSSAQPRHLHRRHRHRHPLSLVPIHIPRHRHRRVQWVIESYALFLAALLLVGGSLGDHFGRRRDRLHRRRAVHRSRPSGAASPHPCTQPDRRPRGARESAEALLVPGSLAIITTSFPKEDAATLIGTLIRLDRHHRHGRQCTRRLARPPCFLVPAFFINVPVAIAWFSRSHFASSSPKVATTSTQANSELARRHIATASLQRPIVRHDRILIPRGFRQPTVLYLPHPAESSPRSSSSSSKPATAIPCFPSRIFRSTGFLRTNLLTFLLYAALSGLLYCFLPHKVFRCRGTHYSRWHALRYHDHHVFLSRAGPAAVAEYPMPVFAVAIEQARKMRVLLTFLLYAALSGTLACSRKSHSGTGYSATALAPHSFLLTVIMFSFSHTQAGDLIAFLVRTPGSRSSSARFVCCQRLRFALHHAPARTGRIIGRDVFPRRHRARPRFRHRYRPTQHHRDETRSTNSQTRHRLKRQLAVSRTAGLIAVTRLRHHHPLQTFAHRFETVPARYPAPHPPRSAALRQPSVAISPEASTSPPTRHFPPRGRPPIYRLVLHLRLHDLMLLNAALAIPDAPLPPPR